MLQPIKTIHDKRLAYLVNLEVSYKELGYTTKLNGQNNVLEIYKQGTEIPKTHTELVFDKWVN